MIRNLVGLLGLLPAPTAVVVNDGGGANPVASVAITGAPADNEFSIMIVSDGGAGLKAMAQSLRNAKQSGQLPATNGATLTGFPVTGMNVVLGAAIAAGQSGRVEINREARASVASDGSLKVSPGLQIVDVFSSAVRTAAGGSPASEYHAIVDLTKYGNPAAVMYCLGVTNYGTGGTARVGRSFIFKSLAANLGPDTTIIAAKTTGAFFFNDAYLGTVSAVGGLDRVVSDSLDVYIKIGVDQCTCSLSLILFPFQMA